MRARALDRVLSHRIQNKSPQTAGVAPEVLLVWCSSRWVAPIPRGRHRWGTTGGGRPLVPSSRSLSAARHPLDLKLILKDAFPKPSFNVFPSLAFPPALALAVSLTRCDSCSPSTSPSNAGPNPSPIKTFQHRPNPIVFAPLSPVGTRCTRCRCTHFHCRSGGGSGMDLLFQENQGIWFLHNPSIIPSVGFLQVDHDSWPSIHW
ncbi:uncharacterized protein LOC131254942 [Magnolia sinica]|uniref:uncharacterized protein LOC131254942 n=1 Tax=Magnolia sinica TaxID=86752 RepID=UPI00265B6975|nr:uncharacterized protein LOC131254942 [Magnolia sinica]